MTRSLRSGLAIAACLLSGALASSVRAEVRIIAALSPELIETGMAAGLTVTVEGAARVDAPPHVPSVDGLQIVDRGQSTQVSIVNGRMTRSVQFQYAVYARRAGTFTLGPVSVREGGKEYLARPLTLTVVQPTGSPPPGTTGSGRPADGRNTGESRDLFLRAEVDKERLTVGEQLTLRVQLFQRVGLSLLDQPTYSPPETPGFWREELPPQRNSVETVDGVPYELTEILYALFPTRAGELEIGPARVVCTVRARGRRRDPFDLFGGLFGEPREVELTHRPVQVRVSELPEPIPSDFTGGVGDYSLSSSLDRTSVRQNEPVTWTIRVSGRGNVSAIGNPQVPAVVGWRSYEPTSETQTSTTGDFVSGTKTFQVVLLPEVSGRATVPSLSLSVYDPGARRHERLATDPVDVDVAPSQVAALGGATAPVTRIARDLRGIPSEPDLKRIPSRPLWARFGFWAWQAAPLVGLALAWQLRRRQERAALDRSGTLRRGAGKALRRRLEALAAGLTSARDTERYADLAEALERYLSERFSFPARGRTRDEIAAHLRAAGVGTQELDALGSCLDRCDLGRFAPGSTRPEEWQVLLTDVREVAERLEGNGTPPARTGSIALLLVLAAGLGGSASAAAGLTRSEATQEFARGRDAYAQGRMAEALDAFRRVAQSGYESPALWLGLGNASYKTGELGWAVYAFERGRRIAPRDPDLRANLELAQAQSADAAAEVEQSPLLDAAVGLLDRLPLARALLFLSAAWWIWAALTAVRWLMAPPPMVLVRAMPGVTALVLLLAAWTAVQASRASGGPDAVVVSRELSVHANPAADATVEFTLPPGALVRIGRRSGDFHEVVVGDRLRGWARSGSLAALQGPPCETLDR